MVQDKASVLPANFASLPRQRQRAELAMQIQAQIAAERVSAATHAVAECEARQQQQRQRDQDDSEQRQFSPNKRPSTPAQQIEAETELFRTIVLREGLLGMAATIAAEVVAGDLSKLGKPRTETAEQHMFLSGLETKLPTGMEKAHVADTQLTLLSVLDQLRCTTVRTVEALMTWQRRRLEAEAHVVLLDGQRYGARGG